MEELCDSSQKVWEGVKSYVEAWRAGGRAEKLRTRNITFVINTSALLVLLGIVILARYLGNLGFCVVCTPSSDFQNE